MTPEAKAREAAAERLDAVVEAAMNVQSSDIAPAFLEDALGELAAARASVATLLTAAIASARAAAFEEAAKAVLDLREAYADPAYAGGPFGAFGEIFACNQAATALRALAIEQGQHSKEGG